MPQVVLQRIGCVASLAPVSLVILARSVKDHTNTMPMNQQTERHFVCKIHVCKYSATCKHYGKNNCPNVETGCLIYDC